MLTNIETLSALERRVTFAVPAADIEREVEKRLQQMSRTVRVSGFRPGKVPMKMMNQQYGPQVRQEVTGDAVQRSFTEVVTTQQLRVAGYPRIERTLVENDPNAMAFSATFEVYPEVTLGDIQSQTIATPDLNVAESDIDKTIDILRKQRVTFADVDRAAQSEDRVTIDFKGSIDGVEFPGGSGGDMPVVIGTGRMLPDFEAGLLGVKNGEVKTFPVNFPADYGGQDVAGKTAQFEITVKKLEGPVLPEVDAEFAKTLGVEDGDLTKMRAEVRANVEREVKKRVEADVKNKVMEALIASTPLELPKALVEMEAQRVMESAKADLEQRGIKMEQLPISPEVFQDQAKRRVTLGLIIGKLVEQHGLSAKPEQVRALVDDYAESYEQPAEVVRWAYSDPQRLAEFEGMAVEANVVAWVLQNAKVEKAATSFDELMGRTAG